MFTGNYNLCTINGIDMKLLISKINSEDNFNDYNLTKKLWTRNNKPYHIIKYNRSMLTKNIFGTIGLFRSIIFSNNSINVFSPPKSLDKDIFCFEFRETDCIAEELIEGTMINLFYDNDIQKWEIASKSTVGANITFFKEQPTFSDLFNEICKELEIDFENFPKNLCYSFVMQHPKNRFVIPIKFKMLYLITAYQINNETYNIAEVSREDLYNLNLKNIKFPQRTEFTQFKDLFIKYGTMNTKPSILGIVIRHKSGERTKIRNPNYEYIKKIRGNNSKLQYQYLSLRNIGNVKEYLKYFPENAKQFAMYRNHVHEFTYTLHINYINCFVKKKKKLAEYSHQFKPHMYYLHQHYLSIKDENKYINKDIVINYVNKIHPSILMYCLNYHMRDMSKEYNKMEL